MTTTGPEGPAQRMTDAELDAWLVDQTSARDAYRKVKDLGLDVIRDGKRGPWYMTMDGEALCEAGFATRAGALAPPSGGRARRDDRPGTPQRASARSGPLRGSGKEGTLPPACAVERRSRSRLGP